MSEKIDLYKLIHSLTPTEKAYFKKYAYKAKSDNENPYLLLFDAILKQDEYNEDALKKKLKNTKLINNFSAAKNYLTELIIQTFAPVQENNSAENKLLNLLQQFPFLYERRVYDLLNKKMEQSKSFMYEYELFQYHAVIADYEQKCLEVDKNFEKAQIKLNHEKEKIHTYLTRIEQYHSLRTEWLLIRQQQNVYVRNGKMQDLIHEKLNSPLLSTIENALTTSCKLNYYYTRIGYYLLQNNIESAYEDACEQYKVLKEHPSYCIANEREYINLLSNFVLRMVNVKNYEHFTEVELKLRNALDKTKDPEIKHTKLLNIIIVKKNRYLDEYRFKEVYDLLPYYKEAVSYYKLRPDLQISAWYDIASICFYNDRFDECLQAINEILNHSALDTFIDLESYCLLFRLFIFIEKNQTKNLDNTIENLKRKLYRDDKMFKAENAILKMLMDYIVANNPNEKISIIQQHQAKINHILSDKLEQNIINYFPIDLWLSAKKEQKSIFQKFNKIELES